MHCKILKITVIGDNIMFRSSKVELKKSISLDLGISFLQV